MNLHDVESYVGRWMRTHGDHALATAQRNEAVRRCYAAGNATLAELAKATGLSRQRIHVIVREGGE